MTLEKLPAVDVAPQLVSPVAVVANSAAVVVPVVVAAAVTVGAAADPAASVVDVAAAAAFPELPLGSPTYVSDWMGGCWRGTNHACRRLPRVEHAELDSIDSKDVLVWRKDHCHIDPLGDHLVDPVDSKPGNPLDFAERHQLPAENFEVHFLRNPLDLYACSSGSC